MQLPAFQAEIKCRAPSIAVPMPTVMAYFLCFKGSHERKVHECKALHRACTACCTGVPVQMLQCLTYDQRLCRGGQWGCNRHRPGCAGRQEEAGWAGPEQLGLGPAAGEVAAEAVRPGSAGPMAAVQARQC